VGVEAYIDAFRLLKNEGVADCLFPAGCCVLGYTDGLEKRPGEPPMAVVPSDGGSPKRFDNGFADCVPVTE